MAEIHTWADGFGRWHANVPESVPEDQRARAAANAIATELDERKWKGEPTSVVIVELEGGPQGSRKVYPYAEVFPEDDAL